MISCPQPGSVAHTNNLAPAVPLSSQSAGPVFLVGVWRSGTSLLYSLLNQHPRIALMYEGELPLMRYLFPGGRPKGDWLRRWDFWNSAPQRHHICACELPPDMASVVLATEYVCRQVAQRKRAAIWGCKSPAYHDCLPRLAHDFPQAKFIIIWRDPNAICRSIQRAADHSRYFARRGMLLRALLGCKELKRGYNHLVQCNAAVHQLHYEDLTRQPEAELNRICVFLGIPFDPRMLSLAQADRSAIYPDEHHALVNGSEIVSTIPRPQILDEQQRKKIARYVGYWKRRYKDWPAYSLCVDGAEELTIVERMVDRLSYELLRAYDDIVLLTYSYVPLSILRRYRDRMRSRSIGLIRQTEKP